MRNAVATIVVTVAAAPAVNAIRTVLPQQTTLVLPRNVYTHVLHRTMNLVADILQTQVDFFRKMDRTNLLMDLHAYVRNMRR